MDAEAKCSCCRKLIGLHDKLNQRYVCIGSGCRRNSSSPPSDQVQMKAPASKRKEEEAAGHVKQAVKTCPQSVSGDLREFQRK